MATQHVPPGVRPAKPPRVPPAHYSLATAAALTRDPSRSWMDHWRAAGGGWCVIGEQTALLLPYNCNADLPALTRLSITLGADRALRQAVYALIGERRA